MSQGKNEKTAYSAPSIKVMTEDEMLKTFQFTSAMTSWWVPGGPVST